MREKSGVDYLRFLVSSMLNSGLSTNEVRALLDIMENSEFRRNVQRATRACLDILEELGGPRIAPPLTISPTPLPTNASSELAGHVLRLIKSRRLRRDDVNRIFQNYSTRRAPSHLPVAEMVHFYVEHLHPETLHEILRNELHDPDAIASSTDAYLDGILKLRRRRE